MPVPGSPNKTTDHTHVYCAECGAKASTSWTFCRACNASLADAVSAEEARPTIDTPVAETIEDTGCPKCGHDEAEVDEIATSGTGLSRLFDVQNRRFHVISCTNCGYSELYRGQDTDVILDLFIG